MKFTLQVWRQRNAHDPGRMAGYEIDGVSPDTSKGGASPVG